MPGKTVGAPAWRRAAWILLGISACFSLHVAAFFLLFVSWVVSLMWLIVLIGSFVYMIATSKRERRAAERLVITPYGIARMALVPTPPKTGGNGMEPGLSMLHDADHARPDTLLIPWGDANTLEFRRLSPVWCSIRIGHIAAGKKKDAGALQRRHSVSPGHRRNGPRCHRVQYASGGRNRRQRRSGGEAG